MRKPLKELYDFKEDNKNVYLTDKNNNTLSYSKELFEDIKKIASLDAEEELYNIIQEEFKLIKHIKSEEL